MLGMLDPDVLVKNLIGTHLFRLRLPRNVSVAMMKGSAVAVEYKHVTNTSDDE